MARGGRLTIAMIIEIGEKIPQSKKNRTQKTMGMVYLYLHEWLILYDFMVNVGKSW